jgi:cell division protein FtsZ
MFEIEEIRGQKAKIKVIGAGGAGGNAINNMIASNLQGVEFVAINTDLQVLETSLAPVKVQIGRELTRGLGAGSNPGIGRQAALEDKAAVMECMDDCDMVFITAGMGGGTGTGAAPVVAEIAREMGVLTVAVVTKPFFYEGKKRLMNAEAGIKELTKHVDTLIIIPNDRISLVVEKGTPMLKSFSIANDVLRQAVQGISDINVDFADVKTIMDNVGRAVMGSGTGSGEGGALEAARKAISNPLLEESSIEGARGILMNITGGLELSLSEVQDATALIHDSAHEDVNVIFGAVIDPDIKDEVRVTVIATGFDEKKEKVELPQIKKWTPVKEPVSFKGSERVLAKSLSASFDLNTPKEDIFNYEDAVDLPAFLRRSSSKDF